MDTVEQLRQENQDMRRQNNEMQQRVEKIQYNDDYHTSDDFKDNPTRERSHQSKTWASPQKEAPRRDKRHSSHPFVKEIMTDPFPKNFKSILIETYNGTTDLEEHLTTFQTCRVFPTTLWWATLVWFSRLVPNSIHNFVNLAEQFRGQFVTRANIHLSHMSSPSFFISEQSYVPWKPKKGSNTLGPLPLPHQRICLAPWRNVYKFTRLS